MHGLGHTSYARGRPSLTGFTNIVFSQASTLSEHVYIAWNFDLEDIIEYPDPLYIHLPIMLCVEELNLDTVGKFDKCTFCGREGVRLPCE